MRSLPIGVHGVGASTKRTRSQKRSGDGATEEDGRESTNCANTLRGSAPRTRQKPAGVAVV